MNFGFIGAGPAETDVVFLAIPWMQIANTLKAWIGSSTSPLTHESPGMKKPLAGKIALVTGGSRGLGAATAKALAEQGADRHQLSRCR